MDPDVTLREIRELTAALLAEDGTEGARLGMAESLAECTQALDEWLSRGGFPPRAWHPIGALRAATNPKETP